MDREQDLEPVQDMEEIEEVYDESMGERVDELFGDPSVPPSFYHCAGCSESILAQDVVWDRKGQPHCPACRALLDRHGSSKSDGGSEILYLVDGPLG